jgi:hypothetical protein
MVSQNLNRTKENQEEKGPSMFFVGWPLVDGIAENCEKSQATAPEDLQERGGVIMRSVFRVALVLFLCAVFANHCWGQGGVRQPPIGPILHPLPPIITEHPQSGSGSRGAALPVILVLAALVGVCVAAGFAGVAWRNRIIAGLLIKRTPPGEAPEHIRRAWVGLTLPLARAEMEPRALRTVGVLSHQDSEMTVGYAVDGRKAVRFLASHEPEAAAWWRENAPHVLAQGYRLFFPSEVCVVVDADGAIAQKG